MRSLPVPPAPTAASNLAVTRDPRRKDRDLRTSDPRLNRQGGASAQDPRLNRERAAAAGHALDPRLRGQTTSEEEKVGTEEIFLNGAFLFLC